MSKTTTLIARVCAIVGATLSLAAHAGDITPESQALMAAPWGGTTSATNLARAAQPAKGVQPAKAEKNDKNDKSEKTAAADEPYDYDPPAGGWHVPGTPVQPAKVAVARR